MYITHHHHQHPPPGYRSASRSSSDESQDPPFPWPAPGIVHIFPNIPICSVPESYTAGKNWTYISDVGWVERGTYQFPQPKSNAHANADVKVKSRTHYVRGGRRISYRRLTASILKASVLVGLLGYFVWRIINASLWARALGWLA